MDIQDPLQIDQPSINVSKTFSTNTNVRGRPSTEKVMKFSPLPKSIVSQLLYKVETNVNFKVNEVEKDECVEELLCDVKSEDTELKCNDEVFECIFSDSEEIVDEDYTCKICSHKSSNKKEHKKHVNKHKCFTCDYPNCSYTCKLSSNLFKHKRIHTDEKPFLCDKCSFRSNFVNSLKVHKRIHTMERPYPCKHCGYRSNTSSNLKKHCLHRHRELIGSGVS